MNQALDFELIMIILAIEYLYVCLRINIMLLLFIKKEGAKTPSLKN